MLETAHKLIGNAWGDEGTTREQRARIADPDLIRRLAVGQACDIHQGAATFIQVARPKPSPLTLLPPAAADQPSTRVPVPATNPRPRSRRSRPASMTSSDPGPPDERESVRRARPAGGPT